MVPPGVGRPARGVEGIVGFGGNSQTEHREQRQRQ